MEALMDNQEKPILSLIQQINSGEVDPKELSPEIRQQIVEVLTLEGYSVPQIAQIVQVSEKTVRRDINAIKERNGLNPSVELTRRLVGDLVMKAEAHRSYLMRMARSREGSMAERSLTEFYAWKVQEALIQRLQLLGYLPLVPHHVSANIYHHDGNKDAVTFADLKKELLSMEGMADKEGILDETMKEKIRFLQLKIEKEEIVKDISDINNEKTKTEESNGQPE
jgi:transposase-like protein